MNLKRIQINNFDNKNIYSHIKTVNNNYLMSKKIENSQKNEVINENEKVKTHQHVGSTLDLGDQNHDFFEPIENDTINKTDTFKKLNSVKKKELNKVTCGEFKLNLEEKK